MIIFVVLKNNHLENLKKILLIFYHCSISFLLEKNKKNPNHLLPKLHSLSNDNKGIITHSNLFHNCNDSSVASNILK